MQLAVRHENFDTFGGVTKPKVALSWRPFDFLLFRSAWSEGFRAPNLQQQYETGLLRSNNRTDFIRCEAAVRQAPRTGRRRRCSRPRARACRRRRSRDLEPRRAALRSSRKSRPT